MSGPKIVTSIRDASGDPVDRPSHYMQGTMEVILAIEGLGLGYREGNVLKYLARYRYKNGIEDLLKARWYLQRMIDELGSSGEVLTSCMSCNGDIAAGSGVCRHCGMEQPVC